MFEMLEMNINLYILHNKRILCNLLYFTLQLETFIKPKEMS